MFSSLRKNFGIPGVIAVVALVFAMVGGAYAAAGNPLAVSSKKGPKFITKQEAIKIAKQYAGKAGPTGPQGPAGANGKDGANGSNGTNGAAGAVGPPGPAGADGKSGFTETLPSGKTETGVWAYGRLQTASNANAQISFAIPLAAALGDSQVHYIDPAGEEVRIEEVEGEPELVGAPTQCGSPVGTVANPKAAPGNLCVYAKEQACLFASSESIVNPATVASDVDKFEGGGASQAGAWLKFNFCAGTIEGHGSWAVTGAP